MKQIIKVIKDKLEGEYLFDILFTIVRLVIHCVFLIIVIHFLVEINSYIYEEKATIENETIRIIRDITEEYNLEPEISIQCDYINGINKSKITFEWKYIGGTEKMIEKVVNKDKESDTLEKYIECMSDEEKEKLLQYLKNIEK